MGLASTTQCPLILQTFEGQYFKCIYAARVNIMYKTTWPVVCLDVFSRERERETHTHTHTTRTGLESGTFPNINRRPRRFAWSMLSQCLRLAVRNWTQPQKTSRIALRDLSYFGNRPFLNPRDVYAPRTFSQSPLPAHLHCMWDSLWRYVTYRKIIQRIWTEYDTGSYSDFVHGLKQ